MARIWEAGVKSSKSHLKRDIGETILTFVGFYNVLVQIDAVLNSRPLSPLSSVPTDLLPLTPAHFIIGRPINSVPDPNVLNINENRFSMYQIMQRIVQSFWSRWAKECISKLQQRQNWNKTADNLQVRRLVLLKEDNLPPCK